MAERVRVPEDDLREALASIAGARQAADDWDHPDFDWRHLAGQMETIARRALGWPDSR